MYFVERRQSGEVPQSFFIRVAATLNCKVLACKTHCPTLLSDEVLHGGPTRIQAAVEDPTFRLPVPDVLHYWLRCPIDLFLY